MNWTGNVPPRHMKVTTEYEDGVLVHQQIAAQSGGGGYTFTDIRCTCHWPTGGCTLHGKMPEEPSA